MSSVVLCNVCRAIPFTELHNGDDVEDVDWKLGVLAEVRLRKHCAFCQLVANATCDKRVLVWWKEADHDKVIHVRWYSGTRAFRLTSTSLGTTIRFMSGRYSFGKDVLERQIDPKRILKWLRLCQENHADACPPPLPSAGDLELQCFRLIDVGRLCVVEASVKSTYVALSYVWGQIETFRLSRSNKDDAMRPNSLGEWWDRIPLTIRDAIVLVRKLGLRYLWVDSICLIHDDLDDMRSGIQVMDTIYEQSLFTLIAASGDDANQGLPGVRANSRTVQQMVCEVSPGVRVIVVQEMEALIKQTKYNLRAWTFQEYFLARRRVVFVNNMMYFQCRRCSFAEDVHDSLNNQDGETLMYAIQSDALDTFDVLSTALIYYLPRDLTNQRDSLDAMAGICRRLARKTKCSFLQGIPVAAFDLYLAFFPIDGLFRRHDFPSWSWTGWRGRIFTYAMSGDKNKWLTTSTWIIWYKRSPTGIVSLVWDPASSNEEGEPPGDIGYSRRQCFQPPPGLENVRTSRVMPSWDLPAGTATRPYPVLQFWTMAGYFNLRNSTTIKDRYDLLDVYGGICGYLLVDSTSWITVEGNTVELIILSISSENIEEGFYVDKNHVGESGGAFLAWFIEWEAGVAERKGIGQIYRNALARSLAPGPVWKEIILA